MPLHKTKIQIVETSTGKVEREYDVTEKSERQREKVARGIAINLDHARYHVATHDSGDAAKGTK